MPPPLPRTLAARSLLATAEISSARKPFPQPPCRAPAQSRGLTSEERAEQLQEEKQKMLQWLQDWGSRYKRPIGRPQYLKASLTSPDDMPFPQNPAFRSQPVLSTEARERIWAEVRQNGEPLKTVSAKFGIDVRRVAAVVRLMEVEKKWTAEGKQTAAPYAEAVMQMLPQNSLHIEGGQMIPHESINDVYVHPWTTQQLFVPVSESRQFTREDAANAFHEGLLPVDRRVPHPELIAYEKRLASGAEQKTAFAQYQEGVKQEEVALAEREETRRRAAENRVRKVVAGRFEFRFQNIKVDDVGPTGRSRRGTGWRYGVPFSDRRRGTVKIPTKVE